MSDIFNTTEDVPAERRAQRELLHPYLFVVLHCDKPTLGGGRYDLTDLDEILIGRGAKREVLRTSEGNVRTLVLSLPSATVSKNHARLFRRHEQWFLEDLDSKNGCCVNGERVANAFIRDGDFIEIGVVILRYRAGLPTLPSAPLDVDSAFLTPEIPGYTTLDPAATADLDALSRVARLPITTLLFGETGTGKEVLAKGMHLLAGRKGPFVAVNCGALSSTLLESQLFGHVKGSFTGAQRDAPGYIRSADGGTLFLDEIGDLPLPAQAAFLRVLQEREVVPVGATRPTSVDVRVIAATHKALDTLCLEGEFRTDLLARIASYQHVLPPLRQRIEDMGVLIGDIARREGIPGAKEFRISVTAARRLFSYSWPLNVRELGNVLTVALALATEGVVEVFHLPEAVIETPGLNPKTDPPANPAELREQLESLLRQHRGNVTSVSRSLGKSRTQVHRWMQRFGIDPDAYRD